MSRSELNISRWLEAHSDRSAGLTTFPGHAVLADVVGDKDFRLVLADLKLEQDKRSRLKIYKGTSLTSDQILPEIPSAIISFYGDNLEPKIPTIGVACGSDLLLYKNNKPFFKFTVPNSPISQTEEDIWRNLQDSSEDKTKLLEDLKQIPYNKLSSLSQELLGLSTLAKIDEFVSTFAGRPLIKTTPITCMGILSKTTPDFFAVSCPVLGTECGHVYVLDPQNFSILHQANANTSKTTPAIIRTCGSFDIEFRIITACRENCLTVIRRNWLEGKVLLQLTEDIVDFLVIPGDTFIVVATNNKTLHCYTKRGQRLWTSEVINPVTCLCLLPLKHLSTHLVGVGMKGGYIHFYHNRRSVDYTNVSDTPLTLLFGQLGQEEHVLIVITQEGAINFKILKRTADFNLSASDGGKNISAPIAQNKPLPLPKRSKLFLEQSMRERQNALDMHQNFQQDLIKLRLTAARALVQNVSDQSGIGNEQEQIKLSAQVLGLGPKFTLILTLENMNPDKAVVGFTLIFHAKPAIYKLSNYFNQLPLIPPGLSYKNQTKVTELIDETKTDDGEVQGVNGGSTQVIRVFVIRKGQAQPVLAATINMPPTEISTIL